MKKAIVLAGPTAVGKTKYSVEISKVLNCEIVSCDSMQLYKHLDIGSAKPSSEELKDVKHYLVDEFDPLEPFSVSTYQTHALKAMDDISSKGRIPLITGGTGLYLNSLLYEMNFAQTEANSEFREHLFEKANELGNEYVFNILKELDSDAAARIHPNNLKKVIRAIEAAQNGNRVQNFNECTQKSQKYDFVMACLTRNRNELYDRINERVDILIEKGLVDEVKSLIDMGLTQDSISMKGIGYKEIIGYINGEYDLDYAIELVKKNTRHYAKRQLTWFKKYENMKWFNISNYNTDEEAIEEIITWLKKNV